MTVYKVTGNVPFDVHKPGEVFEADLDEDLEARAIERGSISISKEKPTKKEEVSDG